MLPVWKTLLFDLRKFLKSRGFFRNYFRRGREVVWIWCNYFLFILLRFFIGIFSRWRKKKLSEFGIFFSFWQFFVFFVFFELEIFFLFLQIYFCFYIFSRWIFSSQKLIERFGKIFPSFWATLMVHVKTTSSFKFTLYKE